MKQPDQSSLWQLYKQTWFRCDDPERLFDCFAIITAYNPGSVSQSEESNMLNQEKLKNDLELLNVNFVPLEAGNIDFEYCEPSFAVNCHLKQAVDLCLRHQQNALYWVQDDKLWLIPVDMQSQKTTEIGTFSQRLNR